jgi:hypothetical protein
MGGVPLKLRWVILIACCVLAVALNVGLTEFGGQRWATYCDYHRVLKGGPSGQLIIPLGSDVADTMCVGATKPSDPKALMAFSTNYGVFVRPNITTVAGFTGGVAVPLLLILAAIFFVPPCERPWIRVAAIIALIPGLMCSAFWLFAVFYDARLGGHVFTRFIHDLSSLPALIMLALAAMFMPSGIWLWRTSTKTEL